MPERSGLDPSGPHTARRRDAGRIVRLARQTEQYSFAGSRRPANATVMQGSASLKPATGRFHNAAHEFPAHVYFRSEEHTSELQSLMRISYALYCVTKTTTTPFTQ